MWIFVEFGIGFKKNNSNLGVISKQKFPLLLNFELMIEDSLMVRGQNNSKLILATF
jgi:hypothetical protein